ncbi:MAG: SulP family inorganic anion transporter [Nitrospirae bacterium]|nr:SulP family inorganic anion transporter [Nitrospirota bacterium]
MKNMAAIFPFVQWTKNYKKENLLPDLLAGITVAVVLIPQSMSYAMIAGISPIYGLYAGAIPPIIAALWGRTSLLATGPVAMVSLLTYSAILPFVKPGTHEFIGMAIMLAFLVGVCQLLMGVFRLGFIMRFVSHPVIIGFTNAAAIIIGLTQLKHLLGIELKDSEFILPIIIETAEKITKVNPYSLGIGAAAFLIIALGKRIHKYFPGAMVATTVTILLCYFMDLNKMGVKIIGDMPEGLPRFSLPFKELFDVSQSTSASGLPVMMITLTNIENVLRLIGPAVIISVIGFMEAFAVSKAVVEKTKEQTDVNQDLIGQGAANLAGSFFMSYPVSGSFSRTAVNLETGGRTGLTNIFSGLLVMATLLFFTKAFYFLPKATLAVIVMSAVAGLVHPKQFIALFNTSRNDAIVASTTFVFALITKPDYALFIGIALALLLFLWESMTPRIVVLTRDQRSEIFVNAETTKKPVCPQILYILPDFSIYFANAEFVREQIMQKVREKKDCLKYVLMDMEMVNKIDTTGVDELKNLVEDMNKEGVALALANVKTPVNEVLQSSDFMDLLELNKAVASKSEAITLLFNRIDYKYCKEKCPHTVFWECETVK